MQLDFLYLPFSFSGFYTRSEKNHNQGNSAIWVGNGAIIVICVMGLMTKNVDYFAALLGFIVGDEVGKQAGWQ